jgi:hypothetical protein
MTQYLDPACAGYWARLSAEDRAEYVRLRASFHPEKRFATRVGHVAAFRREILSIVEYLERSQENLEARCILTGICFAGPVVCMNTGQLKGLLGRCKSSINGSFQQFGYLALRAKFKAKSCILAVLPSLESMPNFLRQWTVRVVCDDVEMCFVTSFSRVSLPEITNDDLREDRPTPSPTVNNPSEPVGRSQPVTPQIFQTRVSLGRADAWPCPVASNEPRVTPSSVAAPAPSFPVDILPDPDATWTFLGGVPFAVEGTGKVRGEAEVGRLGDYDDFFAF